MTSIFGQGGLRPRLSSTRLASRLGSILVEQGLWNEACGTRLVEHGLWNMACGTGLVEHGLWNKACGTDLVEQVPLDAHAGTKPNDKSSADLSAKSDAQLRVKPGTSIGYRLNVKLCAEPGAK